MKKIKLHIEAQMATMSTTGALDAALPIATLDDGRELLSIEVALINFDRDGRPSVGKTEFKIVVFDPRAKYGKGARTTEQGNIGHLNRGFPGCRGHIFVVGKKLRDEHVS